LENWIRIWIWISKWAKNLGIEDKSVFNFATVIIKKGEFRNKMASLEIKW